MDKLTFRWLGHSCFQIIHKGYTIVTDPYRDGKVPGYAPLRTEGDLVLSSHEHDDHHAIENVKIYADADEKTCPWEISQIHSFHDEENGSLRGRNTIYILEDESFRIAFMGDFGCELSEDDQNKLMGVDVMLMPVGGYYTLEPDRIKKIVDELKPTILIPMHYRFADKGYPTISELSAYTDLCDDVIRYDGNELTIGDELKQQTAVLTYPE
ncbi:MAG: MBL fold metallo-hydrolase [Lachnospiraceae bacterium]|nr:MBL fold metallo-hydrolase [Lachnospiraceae bacterium]